MTHPAPPDAPDRALMPDYLRLFALFGIVVVNVQAMAYSALAGFEAAPSTTGIDGLAIWLVNGVFYLKTYGLFSFMFGVGLAFQMRSAERRGLAFGPLYRNRMIGLVILGVAHGVLLFAYDILVLYALTGAILYTMRNCPVRRLVWTGAILLAVQVVLVAGLLMAPEPPDALADLEREVMTTGGFADVTAFRAITFLTILPFALVFQGVSALGWFCLGLAAVKSGLIDRADHPLWARARQWCLVPGVVLSLVAAALWQWGPALAGEIMLSLVAPFATLGYLGLIAALARPPGRWMAAMLKAGGSSLSVYLGQSIILCTLFAPYGLGLWGIVAPTMAVALALAVTAALILALVVWRRFFALGPFEGVLRWFTRLGARRG
ncbi:MAG: DUF418 domain-containing protein [Pseudomonadota bacterium]